MRPRLTGLRNEIRSLFRYCNTLSLCRLYDLLWHYEHSQIRYALWRLSSKGEITVVKSCLYKAACLRWEEIRQFSATELERHWPCGSLPEKKLVRVKQYPKQSRSRTVMAGRSFGQDDSPAR